jgi:hypothetical protein
MLRKSKLENCNSSQRRLFKCPHPVSTMHKDIALLNSRSQSIKFLPKYATAFVLLQSFSWHEDEENHKAGVNESSY